ncbi:hypothetical protein IAT38_001886 [Cryptococcus sp. DSM 104549]
MSTVSTSSQFSATASQCSDDSSQCSDTFDLSHHSEFPPTKDELKEIIVPGKYTKMTAVASWDCGCVSVFSEIPVGNLKQREFKRYLKDSKCEDHPEGKFESSEFAKSEDATYELVKGFAQDALEGHETTRLTAKDWWWMKNEPGVLSHR